MAWRCSGHSNQELLTNMRKAGLIKSTPVWQAMTQVDRRCYVPSNAERHAYTDAPQSIGYAATISAPHMHAHAVEALLPCLERGSKVLDVGSGSGYLTGILWHMVKPAADEKGGESARVVGIDHLAPLVEMARTNLRKDGLGEELDKGSIEVVLGDGRQGYAQHAPYSAIHVGAAAETIPEVLVEQLAKPGRMFIPVEDASGHGQDIWHVDKDKDGNVTKERQFGVRYVPLTDAEAQWPPSRS